MKKYLIILIALLSTLYTKADNKIKIYIIETTKSEQTIQHFGASDAWSMRFIGLWPQDQQNKIADWLFSMDYDSTGKPKGIGLSIWRFNLGAGSLEQGDKSQINSNTRTDCFLQSDKSYDWSKQEGQRHFLKLAKDRGVCHFLAFMNSVPVFYTKNGLATNTGRGATANIKDKCYGDVASFVAKSLKGIEQHDGIHFDYISPVNEPDGSWNWLGPKQEGSPATNREIVRLVKEISKQFVKHNIKTQIIVNESSDLRCLIGIHDTDWQRGNTINTLFSKDSTKTYIGATPNVPNIMAGHSYWTNTPLQYMKDIRSALRDSLRNKGLGYWQTEICIMNNDQEIGGGGGFDFSMKTALYVARIIHHDLVFADAQSWSWWRAVGEDYKDGLIRAYSSDGMKSGSVVDSKLMWALGNYSRFIRPGAIRHDIMAIDSVGKEIPEGYNDVKGIMCSAYLNTDGKWVVVAINYSEQSKPFALSLDNSESIKWKMYRTSDVTSENLTPVDTYDASNCNLTPRSITTFVSE